MSFLRWFKRRKNDAGSGSSNAGSNSVVSEFDKEFESIIEEHLKTNSTNQLNRSGLISSIFYLVVLIVIGLPIWYRTTTPERWPLPDVSSLMVRSQTLVHYYKISVVFFDLDDEISGNFGRLRQSLQNNYARRMSYDSSLSFEQDWTVRHAFSKERDIFQSVLADKTQNGSELLTVLDERLATDEIQAQSSIIFYVLPKSVRTNKEFVNRGNFRAFFIDLNEFNQKKNQEVVEQEEDYEDLDEKLLSSINRHLESSQNIVEKLYAHLSNDNDQDIMLLMARKFDFIFDIIYEDELDGDGNQEQYLVERKLRHRALTSSIDSLIEHFYTNRYGFSYFFKISFITQVLHYVFPNENFISSNLLSNKKSDVNETSVDTEPRLLPATTVQTMLNHIESRRVQHDSEKSYHLILYVASQRKPALRFVENNVESNLIMTPYRGSILILNNQHPETDLFEGFRLLIRSFFRLNSSGDRDLNGNFFTQLEIESVIRALIQKHILTTLKSLEATERLLKTVSNMVIERKIAERMQQSVDDSMKAAKLLSTSGDIRRAYELSWTGYSLGEKAFFDPSLLSLLYFPEDQKYAIYLPLFLPISLPILANLRHYAMFLFQLFRKNNNNQKSKLKSQ